MSRIRTIKPEFWTSEQVMECSPLARLLFVGLWNFCDDNGVHPASCKTLKAEIFPADDITSQAVGALVARFPGCRSRWLVRGPGRALAVRCPSPLVAALVCSRSRAFGLPPLRCGRSGRLVLLPAARVAPPSWSSRRAAGPWSRAFPSPPWCVPFGPPVPLPAPRAAPARQRSLF